MEDFERFTFNLLPEHIDVLDKVDPNHSKALRTILDSKNRHGKRRQQKQILDRAFLIMGLGLLFFVFSLTATSYHLSIRVIGLCIIIYGMIRGVTDAIQTRN